jgi:NADH-quinone oxidoreductase subunit N
MPPSAVPARDFLYIAPEIVLTAWGLLVLIVDFALLREQSGEARRKILGGLSLAGAFVAVSALVAINFTLLADSETDPNIFYGTLAGDTLTARFNGLVIVLLGLVVGLSMAWSFTEHWGEYFALLLWAGVGMMLLIAAEELLTLFLTLEMMTLCLYLTTAFETQRQRSAEGGLKYFVYGSVSSALFLFGLSLLYGLTGTTRLEAIELALQPQFSVGRERLEATGYGLAHNVAGAAAVLLVLVGFGFKIAAVPFHQWAPDAYEGAPAPVTAWIASGSKVASFIALMKVLLYGLGPWSREPSRVLSPGWMGLVAALAAASMIYGNFAALAQRNLKRMLAYSSIAHAGYMLVGVLAVAASVKYPVSAGSVLYYLVIYSVSTVGAFAVAAWLARDLDHDDIDDLNGLGYRSPGLAACIVILMLSLIGVPPLAGFFGKLYMFMEALNAGEQGRLTLMWLVALALFTTVVSAFYYVRVLKAMFFRGPDRRAIAPASRAIAWPIVLATAVVVVFGIYPAPLLEAMGQAAVPMLRGSAASAIESATTVPTTPATATPKPRPAPGPAVSDQVYEARMKQQATPVPKVQPKGFPKVTPQTTPNAESPPPAKEAPKR